MYGDNLISKLSLLPQGLLINDLVQLFEACAGALEAPEVGAPNRASAVLGVGDQLRDLRAGETTNPPGGGGEGEGGTDSHTHTHLTHSSDVYPPAAAATASCSPQW